MLARRLLTAGTVAASVLVVAGCTGPQPRSADTAREAVQGTWVLDQSVHTAEVPFVAFDRDRSWSASDGCNRVYGTWHITADNHISVVTGPHDHLDCAGKTLVDAVLDAETARVPRGTQRLQLRTATSTLSLDRSTKPGVGPQSRPIGYWVQDHTENSPYLSLRADDTFRLDDGCTVRTGTWKFSTTEQVRLYPESETSHSCADAPSGVGGSTRARVTGTTMELRASDGTSTGTLHRYER